MVREVCIDHILSSAEDWYNSRRRMSAGVAFRRYETMAIRRWPIWRSTNSICDCELLGHLKWCRAVACAVVSRLKSDSFRYGEALRQDGADSSSTGHVLRQCWNGGIGAGEGVDQPRLRGLVGQSLSYHLVA